MRSTDAPPVAAKIRGLAAERGLSQEDIARALGISRAAIVRKLNGSSDFTSRELAALGRLFGVRVGLLFGEAA